MFLLGYTHGLKVEKPGHCGHEQIYWYIFTSNDFATHALASFKSLNSPLVIICARTFPMAVASPGPA